MKSGDTQMELVRRYFDGEATLEEAQRLEAMLAVDAQLRRDYLAYARVEAGLSSKVRPKLIEANSPTRWLSWRALANVAAVLAFFGVVLLVTLRPKATVVAGVSEVATLVMDENCVWRGGSRFDEGQRLSSGRLPRLEGGLAVVRFDGGAELVLQEGTELVLESRGAARLLGGRVTVRAPEEAAGFTLRTPASNVTDLGTEFAVSVEDEGSTELHVLEGKVAYDQPGAMRQTEGTLLEAGQAVRFDPTGSALPLRDAALATGRFADLIGKVEPVAERRWVQALETFEYPLGVLLDSPDGGGRGWAGGWRIQSTAREAPLPDPQDFIVGFGNLNQRWPTKDGRGRALKCAGGPATVSRLLASPVRLDEDGVYYLRVMVRREPSGTGGEPLRPRLTLRDSRDLTGDHIVLRQGAIGRPQIEVRKGEGFNSPMATATERSLFWIAKIIARAKGEDVIYFRIFAEDEPFAILEPSDWNVRTEGFHSDARLDQLALGVTGSGDCWFDEIRVARNWRGAVFVPVTSPATR